MNKQHKYSQEIEELSIEATRIMSALFAYLDGLLDAPSPAKRGAGVCLMKDFAVGKLPPSPLGVRMEVARQLQARLAVETDPFLRELIVRELAQILDPDSESPLVHLEPSEN